jgi:hypothetical protein
VGASQQITATTHSSNHPTAGDRVSATATCPVGKILLGGGVRVTGTLDSNPFVTQSGPNAADSFTGEAQATVSFSTGPHMFDVVAYAICTT